MDNQKTTINKAKKILKERGPDLVKSYGANGSAVGYKIKDKKITDDIAIIFYVDKKKDLNELSKENLKDVPKEIEGIPTDVVGISKGFRPR